MYLAYKRFLSPLARRLVGAALVLGASGASSSVLEGVEVIPPELIVHNARITTQNPAQPEADALAVRDGLIIRVGEDPDVLALEADQTQIINAQGRRVIPGLNDSHTHVVRGGRFYNLELRWEGVTSLKVGLEMIREQAKRTPKGQ
jgi:predicted amidohydrolase YtcJ